jgi:hypothetical protein
MAAAERPPLLQPKVTLGSTATNLPLTPAEFGSSRSRKRAVSEANVKTHVDFVGAHHPPAPPVAVVEPGDITVAPAPPIDLIELYKMMPLVPSTMPLLAVAIITFR